MKQELREQVKHYIDKTEGEFYPDDISRDLNIDFQKVMDICQDLIREGKIEISSWKVHTLNKIPKEKIVMDSLFRFKDPIGFYEAKELLGVSEDELHRMIDNYKYIPTAEDIRIATQEELETIQVLSEKWRSERKDIPENLVEDLKNLIKEIGLEKESVAKVLEFLRDRDCLNEEGKDLLFRI